MKRSLTERSTTFAVGLLGALFASGCPVYSDFPTVECVYATDCPLSYRCTTDGRCVPGTPHGGTGGNGSNDDAGVKDARTDAPEADVSTVDVLPDIVADSPPPTDGASPVFCGNPNDCAATETCSSDGTCRDGDCSVHACINQFQCAVTASGPACVHGDSRACGADHQCAASERCIEGQCAPASELCSDRSQCAASKVCVDGRCVTSCTADGQCPQGFLCRLSLGVCDVKSKTCAHTSDCGSKDVVCVDGACVPRCTARGGCADGAGLCVDNGCVPASKVVAECDGQGTPAGCPSGSVCLHRTCYVSCAGSSANACATLSATPVCKTIAVGGTSYSVCGTSDTLGSECDLSAGQPCATGKACIDGYCR